MTATPLITTDRTYLQSPDKLTIEQVRMLDIDPDIMRFITDGKPKTGDQSKQWLETKLREYQKNGYGLMPAYLNCNNEFIGWAGIKHLENTPKIEVGYRLHKDFWGQGLATEITLAVIEYARHQLGINELVAITALENEASKNVLRKCGFEYVADSFCYNTEVAFFELKQ
ncbi:MAG: GNAT family N-acetyltransferase [Reichenbachiella sp.]|uniref:GNAT family N-acetyltransferase n=1 Tax=Reichenbachiella sp. TaxID=2184521 RepID=UPI003266B9D3